MTDLDFVGGHYVRWSYAKSPEQMLDEKNAEIERLKESQTRMQRHQTEQAKALLEKDAEIERLREALLVAKAALLCYDHHSLVGVPAHDKIRRDVMPMIDAALAGSNNQGGS